MEKVNHSKKNEVTIAENKNGILYVIEQRSSLQFSQTYNNMAAEHCFIKVLITMFDLKKKKNFLRNLSYHQDKLIKVTVTWIVKFIGKNNTQQGKISTK